MGLSLGRPASTKPKAEDVCSFIKVTDKQREYLQPMSMTNKKSQSMKRQNLSSANTYNSTRGVDDLQTVPTGMSNYFNALTSPKSDHEGDGSEDSYDLTGHIPDAFKKTRAEKIRDAGAVLNKLQGLMSDIRSKETNLNSSRKISN